MVGSLRLRGLFLGVVLALGLAPALRLPTEPPSVLGPLPPPSRLTDRELNFRLKTLPRGDAEGLLRLAREVDPARWAFAANLNLLLQRLLDAGQPRAVADFLASLGPLPPQSATFAVRGLLRWGQLASAEEVYRRQDPRETPLPCHHLLLGELLRAGRAEECAELLDRAEMAGVSDPRHALAALRTLVWAETGDLAQLAAAWGRLRELSESMDEEALAKVGRALVLGGLWRRTEEGLPPRLIPHVAFELGLQTSAPTSLLPLLQLPPESRTLAVSRLVEGYWRAGRQDLTVELIDRFELPLLQGLALNLALAAVKAHHSSASPRVWSRTKRLYEKHVAAGTADEVQTNLSWCS